MMTSGNRQQATRDTWYDAGKVQNRVEHLILATPTGPVRELLTEANIHMLAALDKLKEAGKA